MKSRARDKSDVLEGAISFGEFLTLEVSISDEWSCRKNNETSKDAQCRGWSSVCVLVLRGLLSFLQKRGFYFFLSRKSKRIGS
jgi:hypothetical protein